MTRISALTALTSADAADTLPILDDSATTTKKITKTAFLSDIVDGTTFVNAAIKAKSADFSVADQTARDAIASPWEGLIVFRKDTDALELYDGSAWLSFDTKWQTYTPTLTSLTLGSGTSVGKYKRYGNECAVDYVFTLGAGSAVGANPEVTLPFTRAAGFGTNLAQPLEGEALFVDEGVKSYPGAVTSTTTTFRMYSFDASTAVAFLLATSSTAPFTFGSTDQLGARFRYILA